jgi:hypothetical protein
VLPPRLPPPPQSRSIDRSVDRVCCTNLKNVQPVQHMCGWGHHNPESPTRSIRFRIIGTGDLTRLISSDWFDRLADFLNDSIERLAADRANALLRLDGGRADQPPHTTLESSGPTPNTDRLPHTTIIVSVDDALCMVLEQARPLEPIRVRTKRPMMTLLCK